MADFGIGEAAAAGAAAEGGKAAAGAGIGLTLSGILSSWLPYISLASTAISVGGSLLAGVSRAGSASIQEQQFAEQADIAKTQALEQETQREQALATILGTQQAMRAGRGVDLYSPTGLNIERVSQAAEQSDVSAITANEKDALASAQLGKQASADEATGAIVGGVGSAIGDLTSGIKGAQNLLSKANSTS